MQILLTHTLINLFLLAVILFVVFSIIGNILLGRIVKKHLKESSHKRKKEIQKEKENE